MMVLTPYDYARKKIVYCWLDETLNDIARRLVDESVGSIIVDDEDRKHVGMLTDLVIFKAMYTCVDICGLKVKDMKLEPFVTAGMNADIDEVMEKFNKHDVSRIALLDDDGEVVGIVKKRNLERFARFDLGEKMYEDKRSSGK